MKPHGPLLGGLLLLVLGACSDCRLPRPANEAPALPPVEVKSQAATPLARRAVRALPAPMPPVVLPTSSPARSALPHEAGRWAFAPPVDTFDPGALLDLRYLNEDEAGMHGPVRVDASGDFLRGDGTPLRFWAAHTYPTKSFESDREHARWLAKRGVNLTRWHGNLPSSDPGSQLTDFDEQARDALWRFVAAMKSEGIYLVVSPYYARIEKQPGWGIESRHMWGLLFFHPEVQRAYRAWWRAILEPPNPYTGVPLKDEPAIAVLQTQNEDSLLFWTLGNVEGAEKRLLQQLFAQFAIREYGSLERALTAWGGAEVEDDDVSAGRLGLANLWELTGEGAAKGRPSAGKRARLTFQTRFLAETMRQFNEETRRFLREDIGALQLINAGNWKTADAQLLDDAERYSYLPGEVMAVNRYVNGGEHRGKHKGWAVRAGDTYEDRSLLLRPRALPVALKQVSGRPMIVTESGWVPPMSHQSEGPFLVSAYSSLTGVDALLWFTHSATQFRPPSSANGFLPSIGKWTADTPEIAGNYPANALIVRNGYVARGRAVVVERRSPADIFARARPVLSEEGGYDPNRDEVVQSMRSEDTSDVDPLAFLVGPVVTHYDAARSSGEVLDLGRYIDREAGVVHSVTGQLHWSYRDGICTLDAPHAQGVTGFLRDRGKFVLGDVTIDAGSSYATLQVVSLDTRPLAESRHVLVQAGTRTRPTGWQVEPARWAGKDGATHDGYRILEHGGPPWQVWENDATLEVRNPHLARAIALDMNGMARAELPVERTAEALSFRMPPDAKYVVLRPLAAAEDDLQP